MKFTDREAVRIRSLAKGYALYRVLNARGHEYLTIDDEIRHLEVLSSDQGEQDLEAAFWHKLEAGFLPRY